MSNSLTIFYIRNVPFTYSFHISNKRILKEIEIRNYKETMLQQLYISKK